MQSGINTLPLVLSLVVASIMSGITTQKIGYYVPVMLLCPSIMAIGLGLMSTFRVDETSAHWIGYQFLSGFGLGLGMQSAGLAAQAVLPKPDIPTGIAIMFFCQQLGGGVFTSVGQNLLSSYLVSHLNIPGLDPKQITNEGATDLVNNVPPEYKRDVREIYTQAISRIFLCGMGVVLVAFVAALFMEWRNIKKIGPGAPPGAKPEEGSKGSNSASTDEEQQRSATHYATENTERHSIQLNKDERISDESHIQSTPSTSKLALEQSVMHTTDHTHQ